MQFKRKIVLISLGLFLTQPWGASAQDISPFSFAFLLKEGQVLSTSDLSIGETRSNLSISNGPNLSNKLKHTGIGQNLLIGLPSNTEFGIGINYVAIISKSPNSTQTNDGFCDSSFTLNKTFWAMSPDYRAKIGIALIPHTGSKGSPSSPTLYVLGGSITKFLGENWIGSIGLSRNIYDRDKYYDRTTGYGDSTSLSFGLSKELGAYLISTGLSAHYVDKKSIAFPDAYAESKENRSYSGSITLSHAVSDNFWLGVSYRHAWNSSKLLSISRGVESSADSDGNSNSFYVTLKAIF